MLSDYSFDPYDETALTHIARHLTGSGVAGSNFFADLFSDAEGVVRFVLPLLHDNQGLIHDYNGEPQVQEIDAGQPVGCDALVSLDTLPEFAMVRKEVRGGDDYTVNIVSGIDRPITSKIVVIIGPARDADKHVFYTIHPGRYSPPFPLSEEVLRDSGLTGESLQKAIVDNTKYKQFWSRHGFIDAGT